MPSKEPAKGLKPYTIFHVALAAPEDIHVDTVLARSAEAARAIAIDQHSDSKILHVRGVGDSTSEAEADTLQCHSETIASSIPLPGARFIKGRFLATSISDDPILDSVSE
ncbi:MAG: hypothetical protein HOL37_07385 [Rhodospirillaceae bacterium]|jgi:hypothetical protein|nr:hypothetical protein [Rhodospirillaceae bacterium]MBT4220111.1 hypothetical protein [Rhodospirillaceae bacterium]MBT4463852.1 hypothetical protein [Rhodospirillaceae bacterium]MBT5013768.1 hypothetical protein [Rhodospirillaceae bacterium]MBT5309139.1 hypothetical protein [Rhodospirillaceae bacterium]